MSKADNPTNRKTIEVHRLGKIEIQEIPLLPWVDLQDRWTKWRGKIKDKTIDRDALLIMCYVCKWGVVGWRDKDPEEDIGNVYKDKTIMNIWSGVSALMSEEEDKVPN